MIKLNLPILGHFITVFALAMLAVGCASRQVPAQFPMNAPASTEAPAAKPVVVTQALQSDPGSQTGQTAATENRGPQTQTAAPHGSGHEGHHGHR